MTDDANRAAVEAFWAALERDDRDGAVEHFSDDFVEEWPQSRERIRGRDNWLRMAKEHPSFPRVTLRRILGAGDVWVAEAEFVYGSDPTPWQVLSVHECRDGKIRKVTEVFGLPFDASEGRAGIVERY